MIDAQLAEKGGASGTGGADGVGGQGGVASSASTGSTNATSSASTSDTSSTSVTASASSGGCGSGCVYDHAAGVCVDGTCGLGACELNFGDCDLSAANGCETNLKNNELHCGACGHPCMPGEGCQGAKCQ